MSQVYRIEKGVPLPKIKKQRKSDRAENQGDGYPFTSMEVGDSILGDAKLVGRSTYWHRATGMKFVSRSTPDGIRLWRIK